jgi:DNA-binding MarR family transcriptional regulator
MSHADAVEAAILIDRLDRLARSAEAGGGLNPAQWEALRFLARANRFSKTPAALASYLGSTRGTVSQTLIALEQKGYVERTQSAVDRRSVDVTLTALGVSAIGDDPLLKLAADLQRAAGPGLGKLVAQLRETLHAAIARNGGQAFGVCATCIHFQRAASRSTDTPHHCALLGVPLSDADATAICVENVPST